MTEATEEMGMVHLTITTKPGSAGARIAEAVRLGHGCIYIHIVNPDGSTMDLKVIHDEIDDRNQYPTVRKQ